MGVLLRGGERRGSGDTAPLLSLGCSSLRVSTPTHMLSSVVNFSHRLVRKRFSAFFKHRLKGNLLSGHQPVGMGPRAIADCPQARRACVPISA